MQNVKHPFVNQNDSKNRGISTAIKTRDSPYVTPLPVTEEDPKRSVTSEESGGGKTTIQLYPF